MKRSWLMCVTAVLAVLGGAPARAAILWQQTFDPHSSGRTQIHPPFSLPVADLFVTVERGVFESAELIAHEDYLMLWWEDRHADGWYLDGNEYVADWRSALARGGRLAVLDVNIPPDYNRCYDGPKVQFEICARFSLDSWVYFPMATVVSDRSFTVTIATGAPATVPEPRTWALMIAGFGGLGSTLRRNRRRAAPAL